MGGTRCGSLRTTSSAQRGDNGAHEHAQDICRQLSIVGQAIAQTEGQREDPLAYGNSRQHPVDEVCRRVRHLATAARGAEASPLARERNRTVQSTVVAVKAQKTVGENPAIEEGTELALDEVRDDTILDSGIRQPGLEVVLDDAVENCRLGMPRGVVDPGLRLTGFSHAPIVVPGSCRDQEDDRIEFP